MCRHLRIAFLGYCHQVTLCQRLRKVGNGLTPRALLEAFATISMADGQPRLKDGRCLKMALYTKLDKEPHITTGGHGIELPQQRPPRIEATTPN